MDQVRRLRRIVSVFGGLVLSGAAFAALGYMQGQPAHAEVLRSVRVVGISDPALHLARKTGVAARGAAAGQAPTAVPADPVKDGAAGVGVSVMPDFVGKRYAVARREAKKLGIKVSARDEYGERVPASVGHLYRVTSQSVAAGTAVEPGGKLAFQVSEPVSYAMGY